MYTTNRCVHAEHLANVERLCDCPDASVNHVEELCTDVKLAHSCGRERRTVCEPVENKCISLRSSSREAHVSMRVATHEQCKRTPTTRGRGEIKRESEREEGRERKEGEKEAFGVLLHKLPTFRWMYRVHIVLACGQRQPCQAEGLS